LLSSAWDAVMVVLPAATAVRVAVEIVATPVLEEV
jgi:hypothetical protein